MIRGLFAKSGLLQKCAPNIIVIPTRSKVLLPYCHPFEYFRGDTPSTGTELPTIHHPPRLSDLVTSVSSANDDEVKNTAKTPLYFKITLNRSVLGLPWYKRYWAGVLFKKYHPLKSVRPKSIKPKLSVKTVIFREATPEVVKMIVELKEILQVKNIWTEDEYRTEAKALLGKRALTPAELQTRRGYYKIGSLL
jgi:hypothetical protein